MMQRSLTPQTAGFTLVEMIVSLAVFSTVVTITVGALLMIIASNQQLQQEQSVMTNLSFMLDSMTRELRTGSDYFCASRPNYAAGSLEAIFDTSDSQEALGANVRDCPDGRPSGHDLQGVSFREAGGSITGGGATRILYFLDRTNPSDIRIMRRVGDEAAQPVSSSGIEIIDAEFYVTGSTDLDSGDRRQPSVTIFITARDASNSAGPSYNIQTTVTQRALDV